LFVRCFLASSGRAGIPRQRASGNAKIGNLAREELRCFSGAAIVFSEDHVELVKLLGGCRISIAIMPQGEHYR